MKERKLCDQKSIIAKIIFLWRVFELHRKMKTGGTDAQGDDFGEESFAITERKEFGQKL